MRWTLSIVVILMGSLAISLSYFVGEIYIDTSLKHERATIESITKKQSDYNLKKLHSELVDLGFGLQSETDYPTLINKIDKISMRGLLEKQFERSLSEENLVRLQHLALFDKELNTLAAVSNSNDAADRICNVIPNLARERAQLNTIRTIGGLCKGPSSVYYSILIPVGGLKPVGYFQLSSDPAIALERISEILNVPIKITPILDTNRFFASRDTLQQKILTSHTKLASISDKEVLELEVAQDITPLVDSLSDTRNQLLVASAIVTVFAVIFALYWLQKSTIKPIRDLADTLRRVRRDRNFLGEEVKLAGSLEIRELTKDFNTMTTQLNVMYQAMDQLAHTDTLTKLPNRLELQERLRLMIRQSVNRDAPFALFLIDLDRFKNVNDTLGHEVGDLLLQEVAKRLSRSIRETDVLLQIRSPSTPSDATDLIARLGGDEFAALFPLVTTREQAVIIANNIVNSVSQPLEINGHKINVGASIGIAFYPENGDNERELLRNADAAMYDAKRKRKGYTISNDLGLPQPASGNAEITTLPRFKH